MDVEGGPRWRLIASGAALVGGLFFGAVLSLALGWYPYFWQWLAYHSGLLALVSILLLLPRGSGLLLDEPPDAVPAPASSAPRILFGAAVVVRRLGETWVSERVTFRSKRIGEQRALVQARREAPLKSDGTRSGPAALLTPKDRDRRGVKGPR